MEYRDLEQIFRKHESTEPKYHLDGLITFADLGSFEDANYTQMDRTYLVSSNNKAYQSGRLGYSIFGTCLNGKDLCVLLDAYMRRPKGWVPGACCLLFYQLQGVNERDILLPEIYPTHRQAQEAMLETMCRWGNLEYTEVLSSYQANRGHIEGDQFEASKDSAWLNACPTGNWDWVIQPIRIYDFTQIEVGQLCIAPPVDQVVTTDHGTNH